jgi:hypothetical protein
MNPIQKKIVSIGFILLGLLGIIAIFIAKDVADQYDYYIWSLHNWTVFTKVFTLSFLPPALVVILVCRDIRYDERQINASQRQLTTA